MTWSSLRLFEETARVLQRKRWGREEENLLEQVNNQEP